ncbi:hypothetical protein Csa_023600, partial [Cucumis sativus]
EVDEEGVYRLPWTETNTKNRRWSLVCGRSLVAGWCDSNKWWA